MVRVDTHVEVRGQPCGVSLSILAWAPGSELRSPALHRKCPTHGAVSPAFRLVFCMAQTSLYHDFMLRFIVSHCPTSSSPDQQVMGQGPHLSQSQLSSCSVSEGLSKTATNCKAFRECLCELTAHSRYAENRCLCKQTAHNTYSE